MVQVISRKGAFNEKCEREFGENHSNINDDASIVLLYINDKKRMMRAVARGHVPKLYIETSVINGPLSNEARIALASSAFWDRVKAGELEAHISSYVLFELGKTLNEQKGTGCWA